MAFHNPTIACSQLNHRLECLRSRTFSMCASSSSSISSSISSSSSFSSSCSDVIISPPTPPSSPKQKIRATSVSMSIWMEQSRFFSMSTSRSAFKQLQLQLQSMDSDEAEASLTNQMCRIQLELRRKELESQKKKRESYEAAMFDNNNSNNRKISPPLGHSIAEINQPVISLRHISEIIPSFKDMHTHLKGHLMRQGVHVNVNYDFDGPMRRNRSSQSQGAPQTPPAPSTQPHTFTQQDQLIHQDTNLIQEQGDEIPLADVMAHELTHDARAVSIQMRQNPSPCFKHSIQSITPCDKYDFMSNHITTATTTNNDCNSTTNNDCNSTPLTYRPSNYNRNTVYNHHNSPLQSRTHYFINKKKNYKTNKSGLAGKLTREDEAKRWVFDLAIKNILTPSNKYSKEVIHLNQACGNPLPSDQHETNRMPTGQSTSEERQNRSTAPPHRPSNFYLELQDDEKSYTSDDDKSFTSLHTEMGGHKSPSFNPSFSLEKHSHVEINPAYLDILSECPCTPTQTKAKSKTNQTLRKTNELEGFHNHQDSTHHMITPKLTQIKPSITNTNTNNNIPQILKSKTKSSFLQTPESIRDLRYLRLLNSKDYFLNNHKPRLQIEPNINFKITQEEKHPFKTAPVTDFDDQAFVSNYLYSLELEKQHEEPNRDQNILNEHEIQGNYEVDHDNFCSANGSGTLHCAELLRTPGCRAIHDVWDNALEMLTGNINVGIKRRDGASCSSNSYDNSNPGNIPLDSSKTKSDLNNRQSLHHYETGCHENHHQETNPTFKKHHDAFINSHHNDNYTTPGWLRLAMDKIVCSVQQQQQQHDISTHASFRPPTLTLKKEANCIFPHGDCNHNSDGQFLISSPTNIQVRPKKKETQTGILINTPNELELEFVKTKNIASTKKTKIRNPRILKRDSSTIPPCKYCDSPDETDILSLNLNEQNKRKQKEVAKERLLLSSVRAKKQHSLSNEVETRSTLHVEDVFWNAFI